MAKESYDFSEESGQMVFRLMRKAEGLEQYKRMQAVYFRACYKENAQKISHRTGFSIGTIWTFIVVGSGKGRIFLRSKRRAAAFGKT